MLNLGTSSARLSLNTAGTLSRPLARVRPELADALERELALAYDTAVLSSDMRENVDASDTVCGTGAGRVPPGKRPVEGGYEEGGEALFHAMAVVDGVNVPGKTGVHLVRAFIDGFVL